MKKSLTAILIALAVAPAFAAEVPQPSAKDPRVRYVNYDKDQVTVVTVRRGVVTRILLGDDERRVAAQRAATPRRRRVPRQHRW